MLGFLPSLILAGVVFAVTAVVGVLVTMHVTEKKWGYTKERERELEEKGQQN